MARNGRKGWTKSSGLAAAMLLLGSTGIGCGGALCDATAADLEGTYTIEVHDDDGDLESRVVLRIDADGNVEADIFDGGGDLDGTLDCAVENDEVCDLEVLCRDDEGDVIFDFTLQASDA